MSTDNITPIRGGAKSSTGSTGKPPPRSIGGPVKPRLPDRFKEAIGEQQSRLWRLKSLIECVGIDTEGSSNRCEDHSAALDGLADYANAIHGDLDATLVAERAAELAKAAAQKE